MHSRAFSWSAEALTDGRTRTFDPRTLTIQADGDDDYNLSIDRIPFSFPEAVQLSFSLSLPIWADTWATIPRLLPKRMARTRHSC